MWLLPARQDDEVFRAASIRTFMAEVRREFEYSIVQAPPVSGANQAITMAQLADESFRVVSAADEACGGEKDSADAARVGIPGSRYRFNRS